MVETNNFMYAKLVVTYTQVDLLFHSKIVTHPFCFLEESIDTRLIITCSKNIEIMEWQTQELDTIDWFEAF